MDVVQVELLRALAEAAARADAANDSLATMVRQKPLQESDAQSIHEASRRLSIARRQMVVAHSRLRNYIERENN